MSDLLSTRFSIFKHFVFTFNNKHYFIVLHCWLCHTSLFQFISCPKTRGKDLTLLVLHSVSVSFIQMTRGLYNNYKKMMFEFVPACVCAQYPSWSLLSAMVQRSSGQLICFLTSTFTFSTSSLNLWLSWNSCSNRKTQHVREGSPCSLMWMKPVLPAIFIHFSLKMRCSYAATNNSNLLINIKPKSNYS